MKKRKNKKCSNYSGGFTLVELLVVISIIALLLSIFMPALKKAREKAKETVCKAHLKQVGVALFCYSVANNDYWPWQEWRNPSAPPKYVERSVDVVAANAIVPPELASELGIGQAQESWCRSVLPNIGATEIFYCPSSKRSVMTNEAAEPWGQFSGKYSILKKYTISYLYNGAAIRLKSTEFDQPSAKIIVHDFGKRNLSANLAMEPGKYYWNSGYQSMCDYPWPNFSLSFRNLGEFLKSRDSVTWYGSQFTEKMSWNIHSHGNGISGRNLLMMDGHVEWRKWGTFMDMYLPKKHLK